MDTDVPYMPSTKNLHKILDKIQEAAVPPVFHHEFLRDLGFSSSNDRSILRVLKYLGLLDDAGKPHSHYRDFVDHTKAKHVLAERLRATFDELYNSDKKAHNKTVPELQGWFKTKTGKNNSVTRKMATTFNSLAKYADFSKTKTPTSKQAEAEQIISSDPKIKEAPVITGKSKFGLVYRLEIHLPDTQNIETYRAIFKALREELM